MRTLLTVLASCALLAGVFSACGSGSNDGSGGDAGDGRDATPAGFRDGSGSGGAGGGAGSGGSSGARDAGKTADAGRPLDAQSDAMKPDAAFAVAAHTPFPVMPYQFGGMITAPQLVTVTFPGDTLAPDLVEFGKTVQGSSWWSTVISGYCEGPGGTCLTAGAAAIDAAYPDAPSSSYTDSTRPKATSTLKTWLAGAIEGGVLPPPAPGPISNTLYLLYFPATTTIELDGSKSCRGFYGYHAAMTYKGQQVAYAVVPECPGKGMGTPPITTLQGTTLTASHELLEAATDPSDITTGYYLNLEDPNTWGWNDIEGGEIADMCVDVFALDQDEWPEGSYTVQRIWSVAQAAGGMDPCAPITTTNTYFNAAPIQSYFVVDVGQSVEFEVDAFSAAPRTDWTVHFTDWSPPKDGPYLSFDIQGGTKDPNLGDIITANNGTKIQVTMTLLKEPGGLPNGEADGAVLSFLGNGKTPPVSYWPFVVLSPKDARRFGLDGSVTSPSKRVRGNGFARPHGVTDPFGLSRR